jgi:hypothetical protein
MTALLDPAQAAIAAWTAGLIDSGTRVAALVVAHPIASFELTLVAMVAVGLRVGPPA